MENQPKHWDFSSTTVVFKSVAQSVLASAVSLCFEIYLADFLFLLIIIGRGGSKGLVRDYNFVFYITVDALNVHIILKSKTIIIF